MQYKQCAHKYTACAEVGGPMGTVLQIEHTQRGVITPSKLFW